MVVLRPGYDTVVVVYFGQVTIQWLYCTATRLRYRGCSVLRPGYNTVVVFYCGQVQIQWL